MTDPVAAIAGEARARHARFDAAAWQRIVDGPGQRLAESLRDVPAAEAEPALESWLRLAAVPPAARLPALAQAWNLGEALEGEAGWLRALFLRLCAGAPLAHLARLVDDVQRRAVEPPRDTLGARVRVAWVALASEEPRF